jgi:hypothetical protein
MPQVCAVAIIENNQCVSRTYAFAWYGQDAVKTGEPHPFLFNGLPIEASARIHIGPWSNDFLPPHTV